MRFPSKIFAIVVVAAMVGGACGGTKDSPPGPLARHFDDMYIASIPFAQKQAMLQSNQDWSSARMAKAEAEANYNDSATQLSIAHNDQQAARLSVDSAVSNKKSAEASADTNRMNQATRDLHNAENLVKAADARVAYVEAYRAYLRVVVRHAEEAMYWREAQYELAKAQLGQKNNIAPKGVEYDGFPKQEQERARREASAKQHVESEKGHVQSVRDTWRKAQDSVDRDTGRPSNFPDPMAAKSASASQ